MTRSYDLLFRAGPALAGAVLLCLAFAPVASADPSADARIARLERSARCRGGPCTQNLEAQLSLGIALVEGGRPNAALEALDVLDAIAPDEGRTRFWRARALIDLGRSAEAEDALCSVTSARALALRGRLEEERGGRAEALADYRASVALHPTIELELAVARLAERLGRGELAMQTLEFAVRRTHSGLVRASAARLASRLGHHEVALVHAEALLAAAPSVRSRVLRAEVLADAGRTVEAEAELDRALAGANARVVRRGSALSLSERARVHIARGQVELARRDLEQAIRLAPAWDTARALLGSLPAPGASR